MKRTYSLVTIILLVNGFCRIPAVPNDKAAQNPERPNILFIMSDDHTAQAVGVYATLLKKLNPTPNIDALAKEGIIFENAFCTNGICTPSRACIITGQYNHNNGVFDLGGRIKPADQMLPIQMKKAGYQTAMIGKWHLKEEPNFDYYKVLPGQGKYFNTVFRVQGEQPWPRNSVTHEGQHSSDAITDSTLDWFKTKRDPAKPFFVCHQYKAPHDFFENAPRYQSYLKTTSVPEPATLYEVPKSWGSLATRGYQDELMPHIGTSIGSRNPRRSYAVDLFRRFPEEFPAGYDAKSLSEVETTKLAYQAYLKKYLRCVKGVDDNLKRLFDYLKAEGLYDNTVIIYTGDQGFWLGEKDFQDKRWAYDPSQRMPFVVRYPKTIKPGQRSDAIVENVDYPAMMLDFAGIEVPRSVQGRSFKAICETGQEPAGWKTAAYYRYWMHMAHHDNPGEMAIRTKNHKLIYFYGCDYKGGNQTPPAWELYDLQKDPAELNNVYDDPAYAVQRDQLKARFAELRKEIGDDGTHHPQCEKVVQEFWDYDDDDKAKAIEISHEFKRRREEILKSPGKPKPGNPKKKKSAAIKKTAGGWILPAPSENRLRSFKGFKEVSRGAIYKIIGRGPDSFNVDNAHLFSGDPPRQKEHAFHSAEGVDKPCVLVKLNQPTSIRAIQIINRKSRSQDLQDRAESLAIWTSLDNRNWKKSWQADQVQMKWTIEFKQAEPVQYLKIGLKTHGTLHLNQIVVFGR